MSNPANWPIVTDAENYLRQSEKRLLHEQRRPIVGHGNIVGAGIAPTGGELDDWNDDVAATNGYFWAPKGTPNGPPEVIVDENTRPWLAHCVSNGSYGYQHARGFIQQSEEIAEFPVELTREWRFDEDLGVRVYGSWVGGSALAVGMTVDENVVVSDALSSWHNGAPVDSPFDVPQPSNFMYVGSVNTLIYCSITLTINNTFDTAGATRGINFWPDINDSGDPPHAASGEPGYWRHYGRGAGGGYNEWFSATRSWWLYPPSAGAISPGVRMIAVNAPYTVERVDSYWMAVQ